MEKLSGFFILTLALSLFTLTFISALCNSGQIDVNTATAEELDNIIGVGNATALKIIVARPFSSVDDLIRVNGIGNITLGKMKTQGLACVEEETVADENPGVIKPENITKPETDTPITQTAKVIQPEIKETIILNPSNPQVIKTDEPKNLKKNIAVWGFAVFCVLIAVLFIIRGKKYKNEFK